MRLTKRSNPLLLLILLIVVIFYGVEPLKQYIPPSLQDILYTQPTVLPQAVDSAATVQPDTAVQLVKVIRVIDGDTIVVEGGKKLRYIGINAPESVDPRRSVQCFGKEAGTRNKDLVEGKTVGIEKDISETDKYGRILRYVYLDGKLINEVLVSEGYALASSYPPDIKYQERFKAAEAEAREKHRGLWASCGTEK